MSSAEKFDISTLNWVKGEIDSTLEQARIALEAYAENSDDLNQLKFCIAYLHQVAGTLQMVELQGAAEFASETELLAVALQDGKVVERDNAFEVLMRAILQLPDYLESLQARGADNPIALLSLLNELRLCRGEKGIDAAALFNPDLSVVAPAQPSMAIALQPLARKLRPYYQAALLKLLRGEEPKAQFKTLAAVSEKLFAAARQPPARQCMWILQGFLEGLQDGGIALATEQKQILGRGEQLLKKMADQGDTALAPEPLSALSRNMLFHIANASSSGERISGLRTAFQLEQQLSGSGGGGQPLLGGFNTELKRTVSNDVLSELGRVKDAFDIFVRSDRTELNGLVAMADNLATIADTLVLLHQEPLTNALREQAAVLRQLVAGELSASDETLMGVAAAILSVESTLGEWGNDAPLELADDTAGQLSAAEVGEQAEAEHRKIIRQVMKESRDGVIHIREAISQYLQSPTDKTPLKALPAKLHEIAGSMTMLSYRRVAQLLRACGQFVNNDLIHGETLPAAEQLDALADAIMSIEYYLEAFVQSRVHPTSVLDVAERGVALLGYAVDTLPEYSAADEAESEEVDELPEVAAFELSPLPEAAIESHSVADDLGEVISLDEASLPPLASKPAPAPLATVSKPAVADVDEEILEIFIEEAGEELNNIARLLPQWTQNPADDEALRDLRRSFHTLKGSGRLVGASALGEFAWAFENMLNRVIDNTIRPGPAMFDMLDQAQDGLRQLVANFKDGAPLGDEIEMLREGAHELTQPGGMQLKAVPPLPKVNAAPAPAVVPVVEQPERLELDPVLLEIYEKETEGHLEALQSFIDEYAKGAHRANEPLIRALHTLTGSSRMAGVQPVAQLTTLLEKYAKTIQLERIPMVQEGEALLSECILFTRQVLAHLQHGDVSPLPDNDALVERASALYATVQHAEESVAARPEEGLAAVAETPVVEAVAAPEELGLSAVEESIELAPLGEWGETISLDDVSVAEKTSANDFARALEILDESFDMSHEAAPVEEPAPELPGLDETFELPYTLEPVETPAAELTLLEEIAEPEALRFAAPLETVAEPVVVRSAAPAVSEDYDPELLDIFLEEGRDILNESEETLHAWVKSPDDRSLVEALQRQLHTLKGGARMAGIAAIGDLGHSLETTFEAVVEGRLARSKRMMDLLQLSHDRLVEMLEQVSNHQPLSSGDDLINQIYALGRGEAEAASVAAPAVVPAAPPVAPAAVAAPQEVAEVVSASDVDPLELLLARGQERITQIVSKAVTWRRAPDELMLMREIRAEAEALMQEAGAAVIVELTELAKAVRDLIKAIDDGHVPVAEKMFALLDAAGERLNLIFGQLTQRTSLSNGLYLVGAISELIKKSVAEQRAIVGIPLEEPAEAESIAVPPESELVVAAESSPPTARIEKIAESDAEADDNRRHGARVQHDMVRVRSDLLDNLVNYAGEVSIYRSRVEQQLGAIRFNIGDLDQTVTRLREQVRQFDIETEAQIDSRYREAGGQEYEDFDPLEFDRFTHMQQLSRSMMESLNDLMSIEEMMLNLSRESETLLLQQSRVNTELQETLMHTRMMPLVEHAPRLRRIVRQTCAELKKEANLSFKGAEVEMDRNVVDRILAPLEHMLRNSVAHGIESPDKRSAGGKPAEGSITIALAREGSEIVIRVSDDGGGINLDAVRKKAIDKGLMQEGAKLNDKEVMHFILESGFSTAETLSQIAGRGVGMDVVASEIKQLGGVLDIDSVRGKGTLFTIRLPLTLSVSRALLVYAGEDIFAIPLLSITGIERIAKGELERLLATESPQYRWVGQDYELMHLSRVLGITTAPPAQEGDKISLLLAQSGDHRIALAVDGLVGNREIVVKSLGAQLSTLQDISGATILADGHVALIIDLPALIRRGLAKRSSGALMAIEVETVEAVPTVMVVDDSITVRKVTERLLKRHNMKCITAKDGVDALTVLEEAAPDVMLLDIEMPRMDGYELATHLRGSERFRDLPIIMITSRTGEKHRQRAMDIGVNIYMGKPYTEVDLMANIEALLKQRSTSSH